MKRESTASHSLEFLLRCPTCESLPAVRAAQHTKCRLVLTSEKQFVLAFAITNKNSKQHTPDNEAQISVQGAFSVIMVLQEHGKGHAV